MSSTDDKIFLQSIILHHKMESAFNIEGRKSSQLVKIVFILCFWQNIDYDKSIIFYINFPSSMRFHSWIFDILS